MNLHQAALALRILRWFCLAGLLLFGHAGCAPATTPPRAPLTPATAQLLVQAEPKGAAVTVDGELRGRSPMELTLPAGEHLVVLSADGYASVTETLTLAGGQEGIYAPTLSDIAPPRVRLAVEPSRVPWDGEVRLQVVAEDNHAVDSLEVFLGDLLLGATRGEELVLSVSPAKLPGLSPGATYTLTARAADAAGNIGRASASLIAEPPPTVPATAPVMARASTPPPSPSPVPSATASPTAPRPTASPSPLPSAPPATKSPTPAPPAETSFRVTEVTLPTYPYKAYLKAASDPTTGGYPVPVLDRAAYEAANPKPTPVKYTLVVLENRYLRLSFLPSLGGRIYECIFKPTGHNEFYRNPVIKPTQWGPPSPPYPAGANWWLAAGGMEWGFPVEEHGYLWGLAWGYDHVVLPDGSVTVSLFTGDPTRPYVVVDVTLAPDVAYFVVQPTITNPNAAPFRFKWWANAMLAPGAANQPGPELRFIFPSSQMTVHSTGDRTLPGPGQALAWPLYRGRDLSRLGNWQQYLGFFERPAAQGGFMGVYDTAADEGVIRIFDPEVVRGAKGFAMGWAAPLDAGQWTDDGSGYVELHGGLAPTFDDWYELPGGGQVTWAEAWYPVAGIGGVTFAGEGGALNLKPTGGAQPALRVGLFPTGETRGQLVVTITGMAPITRKVDVSPARPFNEAIPLAGTVPGRGTVALQLVDASGNEVLAWQGEMALR